MPSVNRRAKPDPEVRREMAYFIEMRRNVLRYSRTFPPGGQRDQHRQIALSLRRLFRNKTWLESHTLDG